MSEVSCKEQNGKIPHNLTVVNRLHTEVTGMTEVLSFDESEVTVNTSAGKMRMAGTGLKVLTLDVDNGVLVVEGTLESIEYSEPAEFAEKRTRRAFR